MTAIQKRIVTHALMNLCDWAIGNRGSTDNNPYSYPEVKEALTVLAALQGREGWENAVTSPSNGMDKLGILNKEGEAYDARL